MAYFTKMTTSTKNPNKQNAVIMGRVSWECIPLKFRPLSNRLNVVLTKNNDLKVDEGVLTFSTLESAVEKLNSLDNIEKIWVIGGSYVYKSAMESEYPCRLYLTRILKNFDCDTFFPEIPPTFTEITLVFNSQNIFNIKLILYFIFQ